jgi:phage-related tail protein
MFQEQITTLELDKVELEESIEVYKTALKQQQDKITTINKGIKTLEKLSRQISGE